MPTLNFNLPYALAEIGKDVKKLRDDLQSSTSFSEFANTILQTDLSGLKDILGLQSAAYLNAGSEPGDVVQLNDAGQLPALDGRNLSNLPALLPGKAPKRLPTVHTQTGGYRGGAFITQDGSVAVWGHGADGVHGTGSGGTSRSRCVVSALPNGAIAEEVLYVGRNLWVIDTTGLVYSWGQNGDGCCGVGQIGVVTRPTLITALQDEVVVSVKAKQHHAYDSSTVLFLTESGKVFACGAGTSGGMGNGTLLSSDVPVQVGSDTDWAYIEVGGGAFEVCFAIKQDGRLFSWGYGGHGATGLASTDNQTTPAHVDFFGGYSVVSVFASVTGSDTSSVHSIVVATTVDGRAWIWGRILDGVGGNVVGTQSVPRQVTSLSNVTHYEVSSLDSSAVAVENNRVVKYCGYNGYGQAGDGTTTNVTGSYQTVPGSDRGVDIVYCSIIGGLKYTTLVVLYADGVLMTSGYNGKGQAAQGNTENVLYLTPVRFPSPGGVAQVAPIGKSSETGIVAIGKDNELYTVGFGGDFQHGLPETAEIPSFTRAGT